MGNLHPDILDFFPIVRWHVAIVRNHWERSTKEKLDSLDLGVETYVPIQRVFRVYSDRRKWVERVAIPGVVFVGIKDGVTAQSVQRQSVALRFLRTADKTRYAIVPEKEFRRMRDFIERAEEEITLETGRFSKGSVAHVYRGPFKGCEVTIISDDNETKAKIGIELEILGRTLCTTISKSDLLNETEWRHASKSLKKHP